jgi:hypothetical protein
MLPLYDFLRWLVVTFGPAVITFVAALRLSKAWRNALYAAGALAAASEVFDMTQCFERSGEAEKKHAGLLCHVAALTIYCENARPKDVERMRAHMPAPMRELLDLALIEKKERVTT